MMAGLVMSAAALGSILSASRLGKLADRIGHWNVIVGCLAVSAVLLIPQAFVTFGLAADGAALPDGAVARRAAALHLA
jgi:MFS family permease